MTNDSTKPNDNWQGSRDRRGGFPVFRGIFQRLVQYGGINEESWKERLRTMSAEISDFIRLVRRSGLPEGEQAKTMKALHLMLELETGGDDRRDGTPSISHSLGVGSDTLEKYSPRDSQPPVAALLHDSVENNAEALALMWERHTGVSAGNIRESALDELGYLFGNEIRTAIAGLTNPDLRSQAKEMKRLQRSVAPEPEIKYHLYQQHVEHIVENPVVFLVKQIDVMRNCERGTVAKYRPVIERVFRPRLEKMGRSDPLYRCREQMLVEIEKISNL
jgi:hypothetical protein